MPNHKMNMGAKATRGRALSAVKNGETTARNIAKRPSSRPTGTPSAAPSRKPRRVSWMVVLLSNASDGLDT